MNNNSLSSSVRSYLDRQPKIKDIFYQRGNILVKFHGDQIALHSTYITLMFPASVFKLESKVKPQFKLIGYTLTRRIATFSFNGVTPPLSPSDQTRLLDFIREVFLYVRLKP